MSVRKPAAAIDDHIESWEKYVGLAKEAASKPMAKADVDAAYYLTLAEKGSGKAVTPKVRLEIDELFKQSMQERIERIKAVVQRYEKQDTKEARDQLAWYTQELARLRAWRPPKQSA